jgi:reactive chlorine resistance protein C
MSSAPSVGPLLIRSCGEGADDGAILVFLTTLSFLLTTPGAWQPDLRFPFLSGAGQFLVKDLNFLGAAVWTAGDSLDAASARRPAR